MKKKYRVAGEHEVFGHQPGEAFEAEIPAEQEARLLKRGSITTVAAEKPAIKPKEKPNA